MRSVLTRGPRPIPAIRLAATVALLLAILFLGSLAIAGGVSPRAPSHAPAAPAFASASAPPLLPTNASGEGWYHPAAHGPYPSARDAPAMSWDSKDGYLLLFGGCAKPVCPLLDTWKYQGGTWTNLTSGVGPAPPARSGASMAYDARDGYLVLFGGTGANGALGDTWSYQYGRWTQVSTTSSAAPSPRAFAGLVYDPIDSQVVLFGGASSTGLPLSDTWTFAGGVWTNQTVAFGPAPSARLSAGFTYDAIDREGVLFGGSGLCGAYCPDTWGFSFDRWTNLTSAVGTNVPSARSEAAFSYDDGRGSAVLIGGFNGAVLSDTWGFSHGAWMYLSANATSSLGPRANAAAAFDPVDGYLVACGGHAVAGLKPGTWLFLTPLSATVLPSLTTLVPGQADQFSASVTGGYGAHNVTWNFGDGSPTVTGPSAGHTYFAAGTFPVTATVTDGLGVTISSAATVTVQLAPFTVAITASPTAPFVGQTVTLLAAVAGGTSPYLFQWSGDVGTCTGVTTATLSCSASAPRTLQLSVTVVDVGHRTAGTTSSVTFAASSVGLTGTGPTASVGPSGSGLSPAFTSVYLTLAIFVACAVGVITYRAGRRREAARRALRPLCYAVPAWSETPAEFPGSPSDVAGSPSAASGSLPMDEVSFPSRPRA